MALLAAVLLVGVTLIPIAGVAGAATPASAGPPGALQLASQTAWVTPSSPVFDLRLRAVGAPAAADLGLSVSVYSCLTSVSALTQSLTSSGPEGTPIARTGSPLPWSGLRAQDGVVELPLTVDESSQSAGTLSPSAPVVHLRAGSSDCGAGVYPVHVELVDTASGSSVDAFTTDLVYVTGVPDQKLRVATVVPLSPTVGPAVAPTAAQLLASPANALARPPASSLDAVSQTVSGLADPATPVTLEVGGQSLQALDAGHQATVAALGALSSSGHAQVVPSTYTPVDATTLVDAGLGSELDAQLVRSDALLGAADITRTPAASAAGGGGPWITGDGLDDATLAQLASAGYSQVVLPPSDLSSSPSNGSSAEPFTVDSPHGGSFTALASNADLTARFASDPAQPVLVASQILAELAQIYFEYPNGTEARAVLAVPPSGWVADPTLVTTLTGALASSEILQPVTVSGAFAAFTAPASCDGGCRLASSTPGTLPATAIRTQRDRIDSFASAVVPSTPAAKALPTQLGDTVLAAEAEALRAGQQSAVLRNTGAAVDAQLGQLSLAGDQTVTLAARKGQIPITIAKSPSMDYPVNGTLTLTSDRLLFANGQSRVSMPAPLLHATNNFYVNVQARTSGEFKLQITYQAPTGGLAMTGGLVTVRSDAVSVVGVALSAGAVLVLAVWWARTGIRRRRQRRLEDAVGAVVTDTAADAAPVLPREKGLVGSTVGMAVGTTLSRLTGVGRIVALTYVLGTAGLADAYNLANTTPNIITDIVIGGVLSATFVPVFVDRLSTRRGDEAWRAISAVTTVTVVVLTAATVAFWFLTPSIIHLYTATNHNPDRVSQQHVAISLLRWFVPQLAAYGLIGLFTALLNTRGKFAAPAFVPIANNVVVIVILLWFHAMVPHPSLAAVQRNEHALILLGLGTTVGVLAPGLLLVPSLARARLHLRFLWEPRHEAMRTIVRLASWTFGFVVANQVALVVILALADAVHPQGAVTAYTYAYIFFQLPYGVVAVSIMSVVTPSLSARWALGDIAGFRRRMAYGLRSMLAIIIPSAVGMLILARVLIDLVLAHGSTTVDRRLGDGRRPGDVLPRPARVLRLPLHGPGAPVDAGHPHRPSASTWSRTPSTS